MLYHVGFREIPLKDEDMSFAISPNHLMQGVIEVHFSVV